MGGETFNLGDFCFLCFLIIIFFLPPEDISELKDDDALDVVFCKVAKTCDIGFGCSCDIFCDIFCVEHTCGVFSVNDVYLNILSKK